MSNTFEDRAAQAYPYEHVGYSRPVPEGCSCDECFVTDMKRIAYAAGLEAASDVEQIARAIDATAAATHHPDSPEGPQS